MSGSHQKVLLIIGRGRSGSTLLDNMLGELNGFFSVGELHNLWKRGLVRGHTCGCGRPLAECPIWTSVLEIAERSLGHALATPDQVQRWQDEFVRPSDTRRLLKKTHDGSVAPELSSYLSVLNSVYGALFELTGARVIVDSSKRPSHAALFHLLPDVSPYFVQLVRDPRAVSYSRARVKSDEVDQRLMRTDGALRSAFKWRQRNAEAEAVRHRHPDDRSLTVRYEDLVSEPAGTIEAIARLVGEAPDGIVFEGPTTIRLGENHTAAGNPSRFKQGLITLRKDDEWLHRQTFRDQWITTIIALRLLKRYGYPANVASRASSERK